MKKTVYVSLFILIGFFSCKKRDNADYSYWYVNNDSFATNNVTVDIGKALSIISSEDDGNRFSIGFYCNYLPVDKRLILNCSLSGNPFATCISFYYRNNFYLPVAQNGLYITATTYNGKARYILDKTLFIDPDTKDSIYVKGEFNEPSL